MNSYAPFNNHQTMKLTKQRGFTLVEIMLAITLSMILIAGVVQVYMSSKTSFQIQNQLARLQENQRISIDFLQRDILQAGFDIPTGGNPRIQINEGANGASDSITIRYASETDCLGQSTLDEESENNGIAVNRYFIDEDPDDDGQVNRLMCQGNGSITSQPIADGVSNMQILVGENTLNNDISSYAQQMPSADRYVNVATADMDNAVSIRIAFLTESENAVRKLARAQTYTVLDNVINVTDGNKRQVVTTTIPLRN